MRSSVSVALVFVAFFMHLVLAHALTMVKGVGDDFFWYAIAVPAYPMPAPDDRASSRATQRIAWMEPPLPPANAAVVLPALALLPRRVHVQASEDGVHPLGHVPWEEHRLACLRLGKDPEREAARGGLSWDDLCAGLVREPVGWEEW